MNVSDSASSFITARTFSCTFGLDVETWLSEGLEGVSTGILLPSVSEARDLLDLHNIPSKMRLMPWWMIKGFLNGSYEGSYLKAWAHLPSLFKLRITWCKRQWLFDMTHDEKMSSTTCQSNPWSNLINWNFGAIWHSMGLFLSAKIWEAFVWCLNKGVQKLILWYCILATLNVGKSQCVQACTNLDTKFFYNKSCLNSSHKVLIQSFRVDKELWYLIGHGISYRKKLRMRCCSFVGCFTGVASFAFSLFLFSGADLGPEAPLSKPDDANSCKWLQ